MAFATIVFTSSSFAGSLSRHTYTHRHRRLVTVAETVMEHFHGFFHVMNKNPIPVKEKMWHDVYLFITHVDPRPFQRNSVQCRISWLTGNECRSCSKQRSLMDTSPKRLSYSVSLFSWEVLDDNWFYCKQHTNQIHHPTNEIVLMDCPSGLNVDFIVAHFVIIFPVLIWQNMTAFD